MTEEEMQQMFVRGPQDFQIRIHFRNYQHVTRKQKSQVRNTQRNLTLIQLPKRTQITKSCDSVN